MSVPMIRREDMGTEQKEWHDFVDLPVLELYGMAGREKNGEKRDVGFGNKAALCTNPAQSQIDVFSAKEEHATPGSAFVRLLRFSSVYVCL